MRAVGVRLVLTLALSMLTTGAFTTSNFSHANSTITTSNCSHANTTAFTTSNCSHANSTAITRSNCSHANSTSVDWTIGTPPQDPTRIKLYTFYSPQRANGANGHPTLLHLALARSPVPSSVRCCRPTGNRNLPRSPFGTVINPQPVN